MRTKQLLRLYKIKQFLLKLILKEGKIYKTRFGKLKGLKSYYRRDINFRTLIGLYETESLAMLDMIITQFNLRDKDLLVADVGANLGYYSMFFAKELSSHSKIYAFEPSKSIVEILRKNIGINGFSNVEVVQAACAEGPGTVNFYIGQNHHTSSMIESWADNRDHGTLTEVKSISIDDYFGDKGIGKYPDLIKMDIEGAGVYALKGCKQCLQSKRPLILIESHTPDEDSAIGDVLKTFDYEAFRINNHKWITEKDKNYLNENGIWGTMVLIPAEKKELFKN